MKKLRELKRDVYLENKELGVVTQHFVGKQIQADVDKVIVGEYLELNDNGACDFRTIAVYKMNMLNDVLNELKTYHLKVEIWDETEWGEWSTTKENNTYIGDFLDKDILNENVYLGNM